MAKARLRKCAIAHCKKDIPEWLHFCKTHYRMVPKHLKDALSEEWRYMKRNGVRHTQRHGELVCEAIDAVTLAEEKKAEKRRKRGGDLGVTAPQPT